MGESLVRCREADVRVGEALVQDRKIGGRYQIVRLIGSGGMGRVYEALDTETGQSVAAKVLSVGEEVSLEMLLRFQQEGAVLATLQHPTIVEVLGTFMERHTSCIVMEFLDGLPLSDVLRGGRLSLARARRIAAQVADALAYAHSRAIVHRDVKPHNIMVLAGDRVKVTDFGIARVVREGATLNTATGMIIGTPHYMAPEQIEGEKVDGRADIYSLGAVLYQMVTGRPPFEGRDPLSVAFKQVHKQPPPPSDLNAEVPEDWEAVILKALAKDPRDRFQTAVAVRDAIASLGTTEVRPVQEPTAGVPPASPPPLQAGSPAASARPMKPAGAPGQSQPAESGGAAAASSIVSPTPTVRGYQHPPEREGSTRYQGATAGVGPVPTVTASPTVAESRFEGAATEVAAGSAPQVRRRRLLPWLALAGAVVLVPVVPTAVLITRSESAPSASAPTATAVPPTPTPVRLALSTGHASAFASGQTVTLRWTAVPGARYRLQIALLPADPSIAAVFRHARTILTSHTSYRLRVEGYRYYYWRVRARVRGRWHPYSRAQRFVVARPSIGRAGPRTPVNGTRTRAKAMRLCWSGVTGAAAYRLWVNGTARTVRATCTWLAVRPGAYRWAVAALVQAARLYSGPVSPAATFTILQPPTPTPRPTATPRPTPVPTQLPTTSSTGSSTLGTSTGLSTSSASTTGSSAAGSGSTGTTGTTGTGYSTYSTSGTTGTTGTSATGSGTSGTTTGTSGTTGTGSSTSGTGSSTTGSGSSSSGTSTSGTGSTSSSSGSSTNCNPEVQAC